MLEIACFHVLEWRRNDDDDCSELNRSRLHYRQIWEDCGSCFVLYVIVDHHHRICAFEQTISVQSKIRILLLLLTLAFLRQPLLLKKIFLRLSLLILSSTLLQIPASIALDPIITIPLWNRILI